MCLKFSIITITHNCSASIVRCLDSVASQSYKNYEHLVVDGGSTDGTLELLKNQLWRLASLVSEPDNGIYDALNKGIDQVSGDIIGILHADDIFNGKEVISSVANIFRSHPYVDVVIGNIEYFSPKYPYIKIRKVNSMNFRPWMLRFGFMPAHTATFMRRSLVKRVGYYRTSLKSAGDFDFFVRLFLNEKAKPYYLNKTLVYMSVGGMSTSGWESYKRTTGEVLSCLRENNIYSNWIFVLARLPIKFLKKITFQLGQKNKH